MQQKTVADVMKKSVTCLYSDMAVSEAGKLILDSPQTIFPIVDREENYRGLVSVLDLLRSLFPFSRGSVYPDLNAIFADEVGSLAHDEAGPFAPTDTLAEVAEQMVNSRVQSVPVVENDRVVGIVMSKDVIKLLLLTAEME